MCYARRPADDMRENVVMHPEKESALWPGFSSAMPARIKPRSMKSITSCGPSGVPARSENSRSQAVQRSRSMWIRTRESGISLLRWRRLCHGGPPVARNGPKDTDLTPAFPRYYSPGLPISPIHRKSQLARVTHRHGPVEGQHSRTGNQE
jgi:hypothetical protein